MKPDARPKTRALWLTGALHAFTHMYNVALMPLYLLLQADFRLASVSQATLLVTVMMLAYCGPSYPMGILADRFNRKRLLTIGLALNALGFVGLALAPNYATALGCVAVAGFGGSFYHPSATAMVARLFPVGTGKALGLMGVGASVGFFLGPIYAGWRAEAAGWRAPVLELGLLGLVGAGLFHWLADEEAPSAEPGAGPAPARALSLFARPVLGLIFLGTALAFSLRDFAGSSMGSLSSLFLQRAHGFSPPATGLALSAIFLASSVSNPLFGRLSDRGRAGWTALVLLAAAGLMTVFPRVSRPLLVPVFVAYGFFFTASYPMVEAALMESVPDAVRGRVFGFFITIGGLVGNLAHWCAGEWVQALGASAASPAGFHGLYAGLAGLVVASLLGLRGLHAIRKGGAHAASLPAAATAGPALRRPGSI